MEKRKTIVEVPGNEHSDGRLGLYLENDGVHFEYDGYFDGDDPESQMFIRGIASPDDYRKALEEFKNTGRCSLHITSGTLEMKYGPDMVSLHHVPSGGTGLWFAAPWTYEKLAI
jgi:hypothetical protein